MSKIGDAVAIALLRGRLKKLMPRDKVEKKVQPPAYYAPNHPREVARRKRQIERGIIRVTG